MAVVSLKDIVDASVAAQMMAPLPVWSNPWSWALGSGTPTHGVYNPGSHHTLQRNAAFLPNDGAINSIYGMLPIVAGMPSWQLEVWWVNPTVNTGDVDLRAHTPTEATLVDFEGGDLSTEATSSPLLETTTNPGQHILQVSRSTVQTRTGLLPFAISTWSNSTLAAKIAVVHIGIVEA